MHVTLRNKKNIGLICFMLISSSYFGLLSRTIRERFKKKNIKKKLTNVSLYVCMSAENSKMLVFVCFFQLSLEKKT